MKEFKIDKIIGIPMEKRTKKQQEFLNKTFKQDSKEIDILKIEWIDKKNKKVRLTFNDFLKVDIKLSHIKDIIDCFLEDKNNLKIYTKKQKQKTQSDKAKNPNIKTIIEYAKGVCYNIKTIIERRNKKKC